MRSRLGKEKADRVRQRERVNADHKRDKSIREAKIAALQAEIADMDAAAAKVLREIDEVDKRREEEVENAILRL